MPKPIVGDRIVLRALTLRDEAEYLALNRLSRTFYRGRVAPPCSKHEFRRLLARAARAYDQLWLITRRQDNVILGSIELSQIVHGRFHSAYLGYQIGAPYARQGLMREALTLAVTDAFRRLKLHRLEANIQPDNAASIGLVKRLGFQREGYSPAYLKIGGRWRDHERWAILASQWRRNGDRHPKGAA